MGQQDISAVLWRVCSLSWLRQTTPTLVEATLTCTAFSLGRGSKNQTTPSLTALFHWDYRKIRYSVSPPPALGNPGLGQPSLMWDLFQARNMILKTYFYVFGFLPGCPFSKANIFIKMAKWLWLGFHFIVSISIIFQKCSNRFRIKSSKRNPYFPTGDMNNRSSVWQYM